MNLRVIGDMEREGLPDAGWREERGKLMYLFFINVHDVTIQSTTRSHNSYLRLQSINCEKSQQSKGKVQDGQQATKQTKEKRTQWSGFFL